MKANGDTIRLLARHSEHGYTDRPRDALTDEPEAVSADWQQHLTDQAHRSAADRARRLWRAHRDGIRQHVDELGSAQLPVDLSSDLRVLSRLVDRIDGRLARL